MYHPNAEFAGMAEDFARDYHRKFSDRPEVELVSLEVVEGSELAKLYDVVRYPAMLVISEDGRLQKLWQDRPFPLLDEVMAYATT